MSTYPRKKIYKNRLKKWGISKNIRLPKPPREVNGRVLPLLKLAEGPAGSRDAKILQLSTGQVVEASRLETYLRRRAHPSYNKRHTPFPAHLRAPDAMHTSGSVVVLTRDFIRGCWEGTVRTGGDLDLLREAEAPATRGLLFLTSAVCEALEQDDMRGALGEMRRAPALLVELLRRPPSSALSVFCRLLALTVRAVQDGQPGRPRRSGVEVQYFFNALRALIRYAVLFVTSPDGLGLPAAHPLAGIMRGFLSVDDSMIFQLAMRAWKMSCATSDSLLERPGGCPSSFADWLDLTEGAQALDDLPPDLGRVMEATVGEYEQRYGPSSQRTLKTMWYHACYLITVDSDRGSNEYRNEKAFQINKEMLRRGVKGRARSSAHTFVAMVYAERGERALAEEHMWVAIRLRAAETNRRQLRLCFRLREWYVKWGETEKLSLLDKWCKEPDEVVEVDG